MTGFDDIQDILDGILDDQPPPIGNPTAKAHQTAKGKAPIPKEARDAITSIAAETFDAELLEIASQEQALSSAQAKQARNKITSHAINKFEERCKDPAPLAQADFDATVKAHELAEQIPIMADLPGELLPDPIADPEGTLSAIAPTLKKVTQGVTDSMDVDAALANVKGAIFADTQERQREEEIEALRIPMPEFTSSELMETMDVRNFATLVTLNTARWHAKVKDKKASKDAASVSGAVADAFETRKKLLIGADEKLKAIHKAIDSARTRHYEMTLPWTTTKIDDNGRRTGARLLPNTLFFEYTKEMAACKAEMKAALDAFVPEYPAMIAIAQQKLKASFNPAEYPNAESIRNHFDLSFDFQPIPKGEDFQGLPKQQLDALAHSINNKAQQQMENAMQDVWIRLYDAVTHMHDRLSSPDRTFHYTMMDNVRETTRLLKHLNVTGNTNIEKIRKYLDKFICPHDAKELRENSVLRSQIAAHVQNVIDKMKQIGGAS